MRGILLLCICITILTMGQVSGETWYVDDSVSSPGDGTSWATAFEGIQEGIDASSDGDTVIVAEGTYFHTIQFNGKNITLTSTAPLDPAVVAGTIIDGAQYYSVVTFSGTENETCILSGFTIRNGHTVHGGGGIRGEGTHATIQNNTISDNSAAGGAYDRGGGLYYCDGRIQNNTITGNSARTGGGLCYCHGTIQNNMVAGNSAADSGGGLEGCGGTIQNNMITGNSADSGGGLRDCYGTIQNNTITDNSAADPGGGLYECSGAIRNNIVWGNSAPTDPQLDESSIPTYSCIQDWSGGGRGNIAPASAGFVDPDGPDNDPETYEDNDYRLQASSPCVDAGASYYWFAWPQRDRDGNCRLAGPAVDIGCYEYGSSADGDGDLLSDGDESAAGTDPLRQDSDGDGLRDGLEVLRASNPLQPTAPGVLNVPSDIATIQESLCVSVAGDEIIVAPGTYLENLEFRGPDVILRSSDPGDPSAVASTVIDGGGAGPVVSFMGGESEACVLAGFTIRNGYAPAGGGICGQGTRATIRNNTIAGNSAIWYGGGLEDCDGTIQNNAIAENSAGDQGGGLDDCDGTIQNNTIAGNSATDYGGGLEGCGGAIQLNTITGNSADCGGGLDDCDGTIQNNTITENSAGDQGGGLDDCDGTIQDNTITGNLAGSEGGGLFFCDATIQNNTIAANSADTGGGLEDCDGTILNNTITGNSASGGGGLNFCNGTISNNTITGNLATVYGGGLSWCSGMTRNCIIWGNAAPSGAQLDNSAMPRYSCIQDWTGGGEGNIAQDPQFVDPDGPDNDPGTQEDNDYRLSGGSRCIDAGSNEDWMWTGTDLDGNPRIVHGGLSLTVDMGAYEYGFSPFRITQILMEATGGFHLTWSSREGDEYVVWSCTDLTSGAWTQEQTVPSAGNLTSWTDPNPSGSCKFYRVQKL